MAMHLKEFGYEYIVADIEWYSNDAGTKRKEFQYIPFSAQSRQISVINRRKRIYTPASYVHELGLKFGIHIMRGIHVRQQKSIFLLKEHFLPQTWWQIRPRSADGIRICME